MLLRRQRPLPRLQIARTTTKPNPPIDPNTPRPLPMLHNNLTRNRDQLGRIDRMTEINKSIPIPRIGTPLLGQRKHHPMHRRLEQPISPVTQQIPNIHQNRREGKRITPWPRHNRHRRPAPFRSKNLQSRLTGPLEKQRDAPVIGMRAGSHVLFVLVGCGGWGGDGRVVQVPQDAACWAGGWVVACCEEVGGDLEA